MIYCQSFFECLPTLCVIVILLWSYYMYIFTLCLPIIQQESLLKFVFYVIIFNVLFIMVMLTYFKVMCTDIAVVPNSYRLPQYIFKNVQDLDSDEGKNRILLRFIDDRQLTVVTRSRQGFIRFCKICKLIKPDRAHHCSVCGTCILKMDHHCPWINNCVCFSNYKFFMLFLFYLSLYCVFITATILEYFIQMWDTDVTHRIITNFLIGFISASAVGLVIILFLGNHLAMIARNETTLENLREPIFREDIEEHLTFNVGICNNFHEVFGYNYLLWFLPVQTTVGDGIEYPIKFEY